MAEQKQMELGVVFSAEISKKLETQIDLLLGKLSNVQIKLQSGVTKAFTNFNKKAGKAVSEVDKQVRTFNLGMNEAAYQASNTSKKISEFGDRVAQATNKMRQSAAASGGLSRKLKSVVESGKQAGAMAKGMTGFIEFTGRFFAVWRMYWAIMNIMKQTTQIAADFATEMGQVQGITASSTREMEGLKRAATDIGSTMLMSLGDAAKGMRVLAQAGLSAKEVQDSVKGIAMLAQATGASFDETAKLSTTVMRVWEMRAQDINKISDIMAGSVNYAKLELSDLNTIFNYLGPSAKMAGYTIEQTAAAVAVLSNAGVKASTIGTGLSTFISDLYKGTDALKDSLSKVGLNIEEFKTASGGLIPIPQIIKKLTDAGYDLESMFQGLEKRSARSLISMSQQGSQAFERMERRISAAGITTRMFAAAMDPPLVKMKLFYNQILTKGASAFESFSKYLLYGIDAVKGLNDVLGILISLFAARLVPTLVGSAIPAIIKFGGEIKTVIMWLRGAGLAATVAGLGLSSVVGWIGIAVAAVVSLIAVWKRWGETADNTEAKLAEQASTAIRAANAIEDLKVSMDAGLLTEKEMAKKVYELNQLLKSLDIKERLSVEDLQTDGFEKYLAVLDKIQLRATLSVEAVKNNVKELEESNKRLKEIGKEKTFLEKFKGDVFGNYEAGMKRLTNEEENLNKKTDELNSYFDDLARVMQFNGITTQNLTEKMKDFGSILPTGAVDLFRAALERLEAQQKKVSKEVPVGFTVSDMPLTRQERNVHNAEMALTRLKGEYERLNSSRIKDNTALMQQQRLINQAERELLYVQKELELSKAKDAEKAGIRAKYAQKELELSLSSGNKIYSLEQNRVDELEQIKKLKDEINTLMKQEKIDGESVLDVQIKLKQKIKEIKELLEGTDERKGLEQRRNELVGKNDIKSLQELQDIQQNINANKNALRKAEEDLLKANIAFDPTVAQAELDFNQRKLELAKMEAGITIASHDKMIAKKKELINQEIALNEAKIQANQINLADPSSKMYQDQMDEIQALNLKVIDLKGSLGKLKTEWEIAGQKIGSEIGNSVGQVFTDIIEGSKSVGEAFGDMAKSIIADILKIITKMLVMRAIQRTLGETSFGGFLGLDKLSIGGSFKGGRVGEGGKFKRFATGGKVKDNLLGLFNSQEGIISGPGMKMLGKKFDAINRGDNLFPKRQFFGGGQDGKESMMPIGGTTNIFQISAVDTNSFVKLLTSKKAQETMAGAISNKVGHNAPVRSTVRRGR